MSNNYFYFVGNNRLIITEKRNKHDPIGISRKVTELHVNVYEKFGKKQHERHEFTMHHRGAARTHRARKIRSHPL